MPLKSATKLDKLYTVEDGEKRGPLTMARVAYSPDGKYLFGQCVDRRLAIWSVDAPTQKGRKGESVPGLLSCPHEAGWIRGFAVAPSGEWLATGGSDRHLKLWAFTNGKASEKPLQDTVAHEGWVEAVGVAPDGSKIATVGADGKLKLWDSKSLKLIRETTAHEQYPRDLVYASDGKSLVTAGEDGIAIVWDAENLKPIRKIDTGMRSDQQGQNPAYGGITRVALSGDGKWLLTSGENSIVFELATGHVIGSIKEGGVDALMGKQEPFLAVGSNSLKILTFETSKFTPKPVETKTNPMGKKLPTNFPNFPGKEITQIKRGDFAMGVALRADEKQLAVGKPDGSVELWSLS